MAACSRSRSRDVDRDPTRWSSTGAARRGARPAPSPGRAHVGVCLDVAYTDAPVHHRLKPAMHLAIVWPDKLRHRGRHRAGLPSCRARRLDGPAYGHVTTCKRGDITVLCGAGPRSARAAGCMVRRGGRSGQMGRGVQGSWSWRTRFWMSTLAPFRERRYHA
jgi:hypothetical protein